jgi:PAS domain S-box-containing protein
VTVRRSTAAIIVLAILGLATTTYVVTRILVHDGFSTLERDYASRDVDRVRNAIQGEVTQIDTTALDWASWDETYDYAAGNNAGYEAANLSGDALPRLELNVFVIFAPNGRAIVARSADRVSGDDAPVPDDLLGVLGLDGLSPGALDGHAVSGIAALESGPLLFAARPVLPTAGVGPARGLLVMGRYLDAASVAEIEEQTLLQFDVLRGYAATDDGASVRASSASLLLASAPLDTIGPAATYGIELRLDRGILQQGRHVTRGLLTAVMVIAAAFGLVIFLLLELVVVRRLSRLGRSLAIVGRHGDLGGRVPVQGRDEVANLAADINAMLGSLEEAEGRYQGLVEAALEGIFVLEGGVIAFCNPAGCDLAGSPQDSLTGISFAELLQHADRGPFIEAFEAAAAGRGTDHLDATLCRRDGAERRVEVSVARLAGAGGTRVQVVARDVTERVEANERRLALEAKIRETQRLESLGVLAGGIAHDFNNILMAVLGNASLARMSMAPGSAADEAVGEVETAAVRAAELTRQLLAYAGGGKMMVAPLDLSALVDETARLVRRVMSSSAVLTVESAAGLPRIEGDETQLRQIVMNLLTNASDALGNRPGAITIRTGAGHFGPEYLAAAMAAEPARAGEYVWVEVADTGAGVSEADRLRMFDPFYSTKGTGRGLGLAAVLGIVKSHGGAIAVESRLGEGTTMRALFPAAGPAIAARAPAGGTTFASLNGTALAVDDDPTVLRTTKAMLSEMGLTTVTAPDAPRALEELAKRSVDLVVLDITMPGMSGLEALKIIRTTDRSLPVLLVSGHSAEQAGVDVSNDRNVLFLQKPFDLQALAHAVGKVLASPAGASDR